MKIFIDKVILNSLGKVCAVEHLLGTLSGDVERVHVKRGKTEEGRGPQKSFILGGSGQRCDPVPFYIPFLAEKVPLSYTFH